MKKKYIFFGLLFFSSTFPMESEDSCERFLRFSTNCSGGIAGGLLAYCAAGCISHKFKQNSQDVLCSDLELRCGIGGAICGLLSQTCSMFRIIYQDLKDYNE